MGFIGVRLGAKTKAFCFIVCGTYFIEYSTGQYSTVQYSTVHSSNNILLTIIVSTNHTVIHYDVIV